MAAGAAARGYRVTVASPYGPEVEKITQMGFSHYDLSMGRKSMGPFAEILTLLRFIKCIRTLRPDVIHLFTIKPVLYGTIAARLHFVPKIVVTITGLGFMFLQTGFFGKLLKNFIGLLYSIIIKSKHVKVIFQNKDDFNLFVNHKWIHPEQGRIILGTGVDTHIFSPHSLKNNLENSLEKNLENNKVKILFPARFLKDKGLIELITACQNLYKKKLNFLLVLCGELDQGNPSSLTSSEIKNIEALPFVLNYGYCENMCAMYQHADIVCLPSYREGIPLSLIEASSCGLPIVTTDTPGCREVVIHKLNGFCVPIKNSDALEVALSQLILDSKLRSAMGEKSRERALNHFSKETIVQKNISVYTEDSNYK